jgi:hypothetical protein
VIRATVASIFLQVMTMNTLTLTIADPLAKAFRGGGFPVPSLA